MARNSNDSFFERLGNFVSDPTGLSQEEIIQALADEGVDMSKVENRIKTIVSRESKRNRLAWMEKAQEKRAFLERLFEEKRREYNFPSLKQKIIEVLSSQKGSEFAEAYFRKRENLSENDMETLIDDIIDLNIIDDFIEKSGKKGK